MTVNKAPYALDQLRSAARNNKKDPNIHREYGRALFASGQLAEAIREFKKAIRINPSMALLYNDLGACLQRTGDAEKAGAAFRKALEIDGSLASANYNLGMILADEGRFADGLTYLERAVNLRPDHIDYIVDYKHILSKAVPHWHFPMINDVDRNEAYQKAIEAVVKKGMHVLEIGTGSGLLAMMAVRAGASHVTTFEVVPEIAGMARQIIAKNGMADRITVINKSSRDAAVGDDLAEPADMLLSEIIGGQLLNEGVLESIEHARHFLLKPDAPMIPERGAVMCALTDGSGVQEQMFVADNVSGFDLTPFNAFSPTRVVLQSHLKPPLVSDAVAVYDIDFLNPAPIQPQASVKVAANKACKVVGVIQWLKLQLAQGVIYENAPPDGAMSHWPVHFIAFSRSTEVSAGDIVTFNAGYPTGQLWFWQ